MSSQRFILALDQGTSSSKALLVDEIGAIVSRGSAPLGQTHPRPGWVEQSAGDVWQSLAEAVGRCMSGFDPSSVVAIGLSTQRESLLLWDRSTGRAVSPVISWQDQRTAAQCRELSDRGYGKLVRELSGLPLDPMFSATKGTWLLDSVDPDRARSRGGELCLGTIDSWLLSRFGTEHLIEIGNAARTQLLNIRTRDWDPQLCDLFGVPPEVLPRVVASTGPFPSCAGLSPLPDGVPIAAVMGDSHAALFAHAGWNTGQVKATYGTGSSVMGLCAADASVGDGLCLTIAWQTDTPAYAVEGNIRSSGATLSWLGELVGRSPEELAALALGASSDGVHLVPAFNGLGAPWWDSQARGALSGLSLGSRLPQVARAALESIVFQVDDVVSEIDSAIGTVQLLLADGGASKNTDLMQLQADLSGRAVERSQVADLSPLGAAHLAGLSTGLWSWTELEAFERPRDRISPTLATEERNRARRAWHDAIAQTWSVAPGAAEPR